MSALRSVWHGCGNASESWHCEKISIGLGEAGSEKGLGSHAGEIYAVLRDGIWRRRRGFSTSNRHWKIATVVHFYIPSWLSPFSHLSLSLSFITVPSLPLLEFSHSLSNIVSRRSSFRVHRVAPLSPKHLDTLGKHGQLWRRRRRRRRDWPTLHFTLHLRRCPVSRLL